MIKRKGKNISYLQSERKPQLLKRKFLPGEYEDRFWQFSANQTTVCHIKR